MRAILTALSLLFIPFSTALAATATLNPVKDNTLYEPVQQDGFVDVSDGAGPTMFVGKVKDADADPTAGTRVAVRRAVLAFDIAGSIPAGSTINSVQLILYADKVALTTNFTVALHRLTSNWGEGTSNTGNSRQGRGELPTTDDATWHHTFYPGLFWATPGGDYSMTISASRLVGNTGFYTWGSTSGMVSDVQGWLNNPSQNFGWIIVGNESQIQTAKRFATRESTGSTSGTSWKPRLIVDYTTAVISGACCQGSTCSVETAINCLALPGVYQGDSTSCSPNPCIVVTGACCAANGTCTEDTQSSCEAGGGVYQSDGTTCSVVDCPIQLTPYLDPLPIPAVATPVTGSPGSAATYDMTMVEIEQQLHSELPNPTRVWAYHDGVNPAGTPGPVIEARSGQPVTVTWRNDIRDFTNNVPRTNSHYLDVDVQTDPNGMVCIHGAEAVAKTVVHLHGGHVPAAVDGYPESTKLPGDPPDVYEYPNGQQAGYLWFHDHALGITRLNVQMGLAGLYLMRDSVEDALDIPSGPYEVPLVIQDRKFNPDGSINYPSNWMEHWFGDKVMVNGKVWPYLDVARGKYRLRLLNGSGSRVYTLSLSPPSGLLSFTVIGDEGGLLEAPVPGVGQLTIGPGERYDVVVDFAGYSNGDDILLVNSAGAPFPNGPANLPTVMKFHVTAATGHTNPLPSTLRPIQRIDPATAVRTRDFRLKQSGVDGCGRAIWEINNLHWDDITEYPELGTTEIWRFINDSGVSHPMHMHLVFFQILDRDSFTKDPNGAIIPGGNPQPPLPEESGWKDTVMVGPNQIVRVIAHFEDYKGKYAYHCHILEHEDHEMMRQFQTVQCGDGALDPTESCDDNDLLDLDGCSARCNTEEFADITGVAAGGGSVSITVSGQTEAVATSAGQTGADVAPLLAGLLNGNAALQAAGVLATPVGSVVVVESGHIENLTITDAGLSGPFSLSVEPSDLWWSTLAGAAGYDVVTGDLAAAWADRWDFSHPTVTLSCVADDTAITSAAAGATPTPGNGFWYLVRGDAGTYDTGAGSQSGSRDAEIAGSGNDCP